MVISFGTPRGEGGARESGTKERQKKRRITQIESGVEGGRHRTKRKGANDILAATEHLTHTHTHTHTEGRERKK